MKKIKVSADTVLSILQGIMNDEDINVVIDDPSAPETWRNKRVNDVLNVDYYTFKHRPMDTELLVSELIKQGQDADVLYTLTRGFCILSLKSTERVYSKENDIVTVAANLEYWIQTEKVKLLEDMLEDIIIESTGVRVPIKIGNEEREVLIAIGKLTISELQETTEFGEMAICDVDIDMVFYPNSTSISDYKVEFAIADDITGEYRWVNLPFSSLSVSNSMTQKSVPLIAESGEIGNINLSKIKTIALGFDGYRNIFIDRISTMLLSDGKDNDNNETIILKLSRGEEKFVIDCIIKEHTITVKDDIGNEIHSLVLVKGGI